jgi:hypothetical protein
MPKNKPPAITDAVTLRDERDQKGDVVWAFQDAVFTSLDMLVEWGDRFYLYSYGLIEIRGNGEAGIRRLADACNVHRESPLHKSLPAIVYSVTDSLVPQDDIVLMGVEV